MSETATLHSVTDRATSETKATPLSVVIPCFNEVDSIPKLRQNIDRLRKALPKAYAPELIFVDDGSTDDTWKRLQGEFGARADVRLVQHEANRGIAAAIATGIAAATSEIVCSIDADCSYDPVQLAEMVPLLDDDVAMVVASPYHPRGRVNNVARWRLRLSKAASGLYGLVLRQKLHTYTSCFRVYRRSMVLGIDLRNAGFVGIAELVWQLDRRGARIVECPATLDIRTTGQSKMRVLWAAWSHLRLIARAAWDRLVGAGPAHAAARQVPS